MFNGMTLRNPGPDRPWPNPLRMAAKIAQNTPVVNQLLNQRKPHQVRAVSSEEIAAVADRSNQRCPFYGKVGQDVVVDRLLAIVVSALSDPNRSVGKNNALLFTGPPSVGKTDFARCLAGERGLNWPFVKTDAKQIVGTQTVFDLVQKTCLEHGIKLNEEGQRAGKSVYRFPPVIIFIDEIHGLKPSVMDALLTALEQKDSTLETATAYVDCKNVIWIGATTERGVILSKKPAFDSRFKKIEFVNYTFHEIVIIVNRHHPEWSLDDCERLVRRSSKVLREVLSMADEVGPCLRYLRINNVAATIEDAIRKVSQQSGIDENGLTNLQVKVLMALANKHPRGASYGELSAVIQRNVEELRQAVLPSLLIADDNGESLVTRTHLTTITNRGLQVVKQYYKN